MITSLQSTNCLDLFDSINHCHGGVPPEMARVLFTNNEKTKETNETDETKDGTNATAIDLVASTSFDVWSFGILLYQLCTGSR